MRARVGSLSLLAVAVLAASACSSAPRSRQTAAPALQAAPEPAPAVRVALPATSDSHAEERFAAHFGGDSWCQH